MDFQALKTAYIAKHWHSVDDTAKMHLNGFAAFCESEQAAALVEPPMEPAAELAPEAPAIVPETGAPLEPQPEAPAADAPSDPEPAASEAEGPEFPPAA